MAMSRPHKNPKTGVYYFRQKVPADLRKLVGKAAVGWSLRTKDPAIAKARHPEAAAKQATIWQSMRAVPGALPHKQIMALVGRYRAQLDADLEDEPGEVAIWAHVLRIEAKYRADPISLERWAGTTADALLREAGLAADAYSRARLLEAMHQVQMEWAKFQYRRAGGDYTPDPSASRFPEWSTADAPEGALRKGQSGGETLTSLFALWETEHLQNGKPVRTVGDFRHKVDSLKAYLGHDDASRVTGLAVDKWCEQLRASNLSAKTVGEKYLAAIKVIFKLAVEKFRIPTNPVAANKVRVPSKVKERPSGFTEDEAKAILRATLVNPASLGVRADALKRAIRWVPWICAYTGARVGEIAQLRKEDLITEFGVPCIRITPESGTVKTGKYRIIPVHSHLVEQRFLDFVEASPSGPLFLTHDKTGAAAIKAATVISGKVRQWVREDAGITDPRLQPNHGWRHRFKTLCRDVGIDLEVRNAVQGHGDKTAASDYGEVQIKAMRRAMEAFPRIDLAVPQVPETEGP